MKEFILKYKFNILFYLCIIASLYINFIFFYTQLDYSINSSTPLTRWIYTFASCIFLVSPFIFLKKRYTWVVFCFLILLDVLFFMPHTIYFRYYRNLIPLSSYFEFGNIKELSETIHTYFKFSDFFYLINTLFLFILYQFVFKIKIVVSQLRLKAITFFIAFFLFVSIYFFSSVISSVKSGKPLLHKFEVGIFNQPGYVSYYGVIPFWIYQIYHYSLINKESLSTQEREQINDYLKNKKQKSFTSTTLVDKNLIIVIVESLDTWVTKYNNGEAVPFLSNLRNNDSVIFIPNVLSQVHHGGSGDAQLMYNTGLLPIFNYAVSSLYDNQYYPSLAGALSHEKDFFSLTIVGDRGFVWNQNKMNTVYHIDSLISKNELKQDEFIGGGLSDKSVLKQSANLLSKNIKMPFYTQIITLSSHDGFHFTNKPTNINFPEDCPNQIKDYIKSIEYVDEALSTFIRDLKESGIYDRSVIMIVSDHSARRMHQIKDYDAGLLNSLEDEKNIFIPLYILNSGRTFEQKENQVIGQIDIYPTLLDIMGVGENYWQGLGTSIFSEKPPTFAVDKNLNIVGDTTGYTKEEIQHKIDAWTISDLIIRKKYFEVIKDKN